MAVNLEARDLGKVLGKMSQEQARIQENIYPDDPDAQLLLQFPASVTVGGTIVSTQKTYADNVFIIDHPVYGNIDSSTLLLDGGYAWENYSIGRRAYYAFESNVSDSTSNGYNGTAVGITYTTGEIGSAAVFNGTSSYVDLAAASTMMPSNSSWSISSWIRVTAAGAGIVDNRVVTFYRPGATSTAISLAVGTSSSTGLSCRAAVQYRNAALTTTNLDVGSVLYNTWYHFVVTYDGITFRPYLNGVATTTSANDFAGFGSGNGKIGTFDATSAWFNGRIDEVGCWSRVLSSGEVAELYRQGGVDTVYPNNLLSSTLLSSINL